LRKALAGVFTNRANTCACVCGRWTMTSNISAHHHRPDEQGKHLCVWQVAHATVPPISIPAPCSFAVSFGVIQQTNSSIHHVVS
jgi:hypothetical protein